MPDIVVVLPGITGSVLRKDGRDLWAPSPEGILGAIRTLGHNLQHLKITQDPPDAADLGDGVTADRLMPDVHLIPGFWKIDGYTKLLNQIQRNFVVERNRNLFEFPYDWRRDNRVAAHRLARESHAWLKAWRESSGHANAKLILVAHSMGGLVARHFLEALQGWQNTRMLITFGTPFRGALNALNFVCNGYQKNLGPIRVADLTELLRSFTSVYQLLPTYPCYDPGDGRLLRVGETKGIPGLDPDRAAKALAFHREIDTHVGVHLNDEMYKKNTYKLHPVVGTFQQTLQAAKLTSGKVLFSTRFPNQDLDGDGTVPRPSATPNELSGQDAELFIAETHGSLQNSDPALVQLSRLLSGTTLRWEAFWGPGALSIALHMEDSYTSKERVTVRARYEPSGLKLTLQATLTNLGTQKDAVVQLQHGSDGFHTARVGPLTAGTYRVTVTTGTDSVTDLFVVANV